MGVCVCEVCVVLVFHSLQNETSPAAKTLLEKEALLLLEEASGHLAYYCRVDMTMGGEELTSQSGRIIFSPEVLVQVTPLNKMKGSLSLTLVVNHLKECTENFPSLSEELQKLERKLESETGLEDSEVSEPGNMYVCQEFVLSP